MARRSAPSTQPSYLPHPLSVPKRALNDPNQSAFSRCVTSGLAMLSKRRNSYRFLHNEILASEKLQGNISILTGVTLFFGGIAAVRTWGELMIPA